ncbi:fungal-specific transcription factor domain-containing protein [Aspergillus pseudotamarii]|uniref:Fungal-specific transcription factor domain-containing protein n=1 Tax=Aspergillus pseudotamarii TaxID=132259 RepID=A0A5N6T3Z8_ASPPS|nr:fungal-specific transcription factor domain-containing protein [Aspergillus pseudotamarii]KAE8141022.1 fungal-specific transcription factor domain-containing protein [Aspergillus pseudotamarii]
MVHSYHLIPEDKEVDVYAPLHTFRIDSLLAVELCNWIGKAFAADIAVMEVMGDTISPSRNRSSRVESPNTAESFISPSTPGFSATVDTSSRVASNGNHLPRYSSANAPAVEATANTLPAEVSSGHTVLPTTQEPVITFPDPHDFYDPLEDFTSFIDSMGLALDSESLVDLRSIPLEHAPLSNVLQADNYHTRVSQISRPDYDEEQSEGAHRAQSPTLLPIPLNPAAPYSLESAVQAAVYMPQLKITEIQRAHIVQALGPFQHLMPGFTLPSRDSLTRFLNAYFDRVYPHFPFMHGPSFLPENYSLELILSMAASGAQYRYEHRKGRLLFHASKAIFHERQRHREAATCESNLLPQPIIVNPDPYSPSPTITDDIRCLLNLAIYATWQQDPEVVKSVCGLQSTLVRLLRESGLVEVNIPDSDKLDWQTWLRLELDRRVKLFAFAFLNLQSIAYNLPPILLSHEINLRLPCTCEEWRAVDETNWRQFRRDIPREQSLFQDALTFLLAGKDAPSSIKPIPSPSASIILIHGLLHRILLSRQASLSGVTEHEQRLLNWVRRIVEEGRTSLDDSEDNTSDGLNCERLAFFVVHLWARIMRGNAQWPFIDIIGHSLELYASGRYVLS